MHDQVDDDGNAVQILDTIVDYRKDSNAVDKTDIHLRINNGQQRLRHATTGWSLLIL